MSKRKPAKRRKSKASPRSTRSKSRSIAPTSKRSRPRTDRLRAIVQAARGRAKRCKGARAGFDLDEPENLVLLHARFATGVCEVTGIPFNMKAVKTRRWNSPSIDRIDATKGYTYENVRFVLWSVNAGLSDWGEAVFELIAAAWLHRRAIERCLTCNQ